MSPPLYNVYEVGSCWNVDTMSPLLYTVKKAELCWNVDRMSLTQDIVSTSRHFCWNVGTMSLPLCMQYTAQEVELYCNVDTVRRIMLEC
jgi:hypothetical protein